MSLRFPRLQSAAARVSLRLIKIVALVALVYEVAFNAFLLSGGLSHVLNGKPDSLLVTYRWGWSIIPGYVQARGLRIRSKDNGIEFDLRIERCGFHVVLSELLHRRFHVTHVGGDGITFVSRFRILPEAATAQTLAAIPQIEGLERMPIKEPETPPLDDAHYILWTVALDDVVAESVHEVWIHTFRYEGDARIVGGFYLKPQRWAHVGPNDTAFIRGGRVTVAKHTIASEVSGRIEATVDPFDPRVTGGIDVFRKGSGRVLLDAKMPSVDFMRYWTEDFAADGGVHVAGGAGEARSDFRIDHGRVAPGTRIDASFRGVRASRGEGAVSGDVAVRVTDGREAGAELFETVVSATGLRFVVRGFEAAPITAQRADVGLHAAGVDFVDKPLADAAITGRLPRAEVTDARLAQALLGADGAVRVEGGSGSAGAEIDYAEGVAHGSARLAIEGARVALGNKTTITGDVRGEVMLRRFTPASGRADLAGTRVLVHGVSAPGNTDDWWANVQLASATLEPGATPVWHSQILAEARDTRPFMAKFVDASSLPTWLTPLLTANDLRVRAALSAGREGIAVRDCVATAGPLHALATVAKRGAATDAVAVVGAGALAVGIELRDGSTRVELADAERWYRRKAGEVGAR